MVSIEWMRRQLQAVMDAKASSGSDATSRNPNPKGTINPGSATDVVLTYMRSVRSNNDRWMSRAQLVIATGRSAKSVDWALAFLRQLDLIESIPDGERPRCGACYLRYRAKRMKP